MLHPAALFSNLPTSRLPDPFGLVQFAEHHSLFWPRLSYPTPSYAELGQDSPIPLLREFSTSDEPMSLLSLDGTRLTLPSHLPPETSSISSSAVGVSCVDPPVGNSIASPLPPIPSPISIKHESETTTSTTTPTTNTISTTQKLARNSNEPIMCVGCRTSIDRTQSCLRLSDGQLWHVDCLVCALCGRALDTEFSCFNRAGTIYCREDYLRYFGHAKHLISCAACNREMKPNDVCIRSTPNVVFHCTCFVCSQCNRPLKPGDRYALRDGKPICETDFGTPQTVMNSIGPNGNGSEMEASVAHSTPIRTVTEDDVQKTLLSQNCKTTTLNPYASYELYPSFGGLIPSSKLSWEPDAQHHNYPFDPCDHSHPHHNHHHYRHNHRSPSPILTPLFDDPSHRLVYPHTTPSSSVVCHPSPHSVITTNGCHLTADNSDQQTTGFDALSALTAVGLLTARAAAAAGVSRDSTGSHFPYSISTSTTPMLNVSNGGEGGPHGLLKLIEPSPLGGGLDDGCDGFEASNMTGGGGGGGSLLSDPTTMMMLSANANLMLPSSIVGQPKRNRKRRTGLHPSFAAAYCMGISTRQKRMRTSFKHHQLRAMKAYFGVNHNPDVKDLKVLTEKTGLSKRVLQVWFQNARAKYRRSLLKRENTSGGVGGSNCLDGQGATTATSRLTGSMSAKSPSYSTDLNGNSVPHGQQHPSLSDSGDSRLSPLQLTTDTGSHDSSSMHGSMYACTTEGDFSRPDSVDLLQRQPRWMDPNLSQEAIERFETTRHGSECPWPLHPEEMMALSKSPNVTTTPTSATTPSSFAFTLEHGSMVRGSSLVELCSLNRVHS